MPVLNFAAAAVVIRVVLFSLGFVFMYLCCICIVVLAL